MGLDEISWQIVPNTVTKRMRNLSFIHKLIPSKRLCRRTKVMNTTIKHLYTLKNYREYVKIKTAILRNLSNNSDIDDNDGLSDNDYSVLHKSDLSITNYMTHITRMDTDHLYEAELDVSDSNILSVVSRKTNVQQSENKSSSNTNLGWQDIVKKKDVSSTCSLEHNIQESKSNNLNETTNHKTFASSSNKAVSEKSTKLLDQETRITEMCFNDVTCNIDKEEEISKDNTKLIEKEEHRSNGVYKKLNKKIDTKTLECKKELNCLKQDSTSMTVQGVCELPTNTNANLKQSDTTVTVGYLKVQEESVDEIKNSDSLKMQSLFNGKTNQLKDSGIDEDSEEEFQDNGKDVYARKQRKVQDICENTNLTSPAANFKSVSTVETTLSNTDNVASDIHDISDTTASQCTALVTPKKSNNKEEEENKVERIKLQPKVTGTKIIKRRYRIISDSILSLDTFFDSKADDSPVSNKVMDPIYTEHNAEDSTSPVFKRRSQQMKRFNLTVDSESSLSDDDNEYCNTENMRNKLFKRAKESSDLSDSQDGNMSFKHRLSLQNSNRFKKHKNYAFKNSSKGKNIYLREKHINNEESVQLIRSVEVNSNKCKNALDCSGKKKTSSQNSFKQSVHYSNNESDTSEENKKLEKLFVKNDKTERTNKNDETTTQSTFKNSIMQTRPKNLQELMEKENLIYETALPSVTLKDLQENNVFLLEIPSVVLETELLEQKFVLTKKKLKLGEHKYRIAFNDTDQMFGVLNTGKSHTNYKAVNMKSMKRFVAYQKVVRTASEKSSNKCTNIEIDDDTEIPI